MSAAWAVEEVVEAPVARPVRVEEAYEVSSGATGAVIVGIPGAMACSLLTVVALTGFGGGLFGLVWWIAGGAWVAYATAMLVLLWMFEA